MKLELLAPNLHKVYLGELAIYYSYETPIGFSYHGNLVLSENVWTKATARHLNVIDRDKAYRIDNYSMMQELRLILHKLEV